MYPHLHHRKPFNQPFDMPSYESLFSSNYNLCEENKSLLYDPNESDGINSDQDLDPDMNYGSTRDVEDKSHVKDVKPSQDFLLAVHDDVVKEISDEFLNNLLLDEYIPSEHRPLKYSKYKSNAALVGDNMISIDSDDVNLDEGNCVVHTYACQWLSSHS